MTTLKQGRWVKIHEQGQANFETAENVMDITVGDSRYQAEVTFTAGTCTYRNVNASLKMSFFGGMECHFSPVSK